MTNEAAPTLGHHAVIEPGARLGAGVSVGHHATVHADVTVGDGSIRRDFLYVDDCIEAILLAASADAPRAEVMNVGVDVPTTFRDLAVELEAQTGAHWEYAPFTAERKAQEPGDFYSDISKIRRLLGWAPRTPLREGLEKTLAFYRLHKSHYW